jgi:hypothetical protein
MVEAKKKLKPYTWKIENSLRNEMELNIWSIVNER